MFEIEQGDNGRVVFRGRLDAAQCPKAQAFLDAAPQASEFDFGGLEYISSAGLGVLLRAHKKAMAGGGKLRLVQVNNHIFDIFRYSGFDQLFEVERSG
jgi:anti-sigma B factor antagonist